LKEKTMNITIHQIVQLAEALREHQASRGYRHARQESGVALAAAYVRIIDDGIAFDGVTSGVLNATRKLQQLRSTIAQLDEVERDAIKPAIERRMVALADAIEAWAHPPSSAPEEPDPTTPAAAAGEEMPL
jgi:hypothetical protein